MARMDQQELDMVLKSEEAIKALKDIIDIQCSDGNYNHDPYMHGMTNGLLLANGIIKDIEPKFVEAPNYWKPISKAKLNGKEVWLGWKPFTDQETGKVTSGVVPKRGMWDIGSRQWIVHWEDHGDKGGYRPIPFDPQPDYFAEGFTPPCPTE